MDFEQYWQLIGGDIHFSDRKTAAADLWAQHPEKHEAIIDWLKTHGRYPGRNPYFFIQDFQLRRRKILTYNDYVNRYHTDAELDGWVRKHLPEEQRTIYIKMN